MLRKVIMISISSDVLETHRLHINGPVISVSLVIGFVFNEIPVLPTLPCVVDKEEPEAIPALVSALEG